MRIVESVCKIQDLQDTPLRRCLKCSCEVRGEPHYFLKMKRSDAF